MQSSLQQHPEVARRFQDLHPPFPTAQAAVIEANRCLNCFDAPCMGACPTHIDVPRFIKKIASGNLRGSALTILDANILGASCARVCPVDVLCEGACVMHHQHQKPIQIGRLQRFAMDDFYARGESLPLRQAAPRTERVVCIGAGPASLACAAELRQHGFSVTVLDRRPLPGGLNTYGVAEYKLSAPDSLREAELVRRLGVEFRFGVDVSNETTLTALEAEFDVIFLGMGLGAPRKLGIPGEDHPAVVNALDFIASYKTGGRVSVGHSVVVIGAGNTAIDAASAARRLGAEEVRIVHRRGEGDISAFAFEYEHARREGVQFHWRAMPVSIHIADGELVALECARTRVTPDGKVEVLSGAPLRIPCDMVIPAIGQSSLVEFLSHARGIRLDHGRVVIDRATGLTGNPKYYAGGDCVNGGREVVDAVADGKRAALGIAAALEVAHV